MASTLPYKSAFEFTEGVKPIEIDVENVCVADHGVLPQDPEYIKNVIFSGEDDKIYIRPFSDLKITTITNVTLLMGMVHDMHRLYYSLPCMPYNQYTKDVEFPHGTITSIRMEGAYRGEPGGSFPNSIMINIWASTGKPDPSGKEIIHSDGTREPKMICTKVSAKITQLKIQMCGVATFEMALAVSHEIVRQINDTLDLLVNIRSKPLIYSTIRQWLSIEGKGEPYYEPFVEYGSLPGQKQIMHIMDWSKVKTPPDECKELFQSLLTHIYDQRFYEELMWVVNHHSTVDPGKVSDYLKVRKVGLSMTNYNYMLGFKIDRQLLYEYLKASGINAVYNNTKSSYVLVRMMSRIPNGKSVIRREEQNGRQSFMIQESGKIMHSGTETIQMSTCYYKLMGMIASIRDQIASNIPTLQEFLSGSQRKRGRKKKKTESDMPPIYDPYKEYAEELLISERSTPQLMLDKSQPNTSSISDSQSMLQNVTLEKPTFIRNLDSMYNNEHCEIVPESELAREERLRYKGDDQASILLNPRKQISMVGVSTILSKVGLEELCTNHISSPVHFPPSGSVSMETVTPSSSSHSSSSRSEYVNQELSQQMRSMSTMSSQSPTIQPQTFVQGEQQVQPIRNKFGQIIDENPYIQESTFGYGQQYHAPSDTRFYLE